MRPQYSPGRVLPGWAVLAAVAIVSIASHPLSAAAVTYDYGSFELSEPTPTVAELALYESRLFDDRRSQSRAITANVDSGSYSCPLAFQDAAAVDGNDTQRAVAVLGYRACPFEIGTLRAEGWVKVRSPITIDIEAMEGPVAFVSSQSAVPFVAEAQSLPLATPTAIGVTWRFRKRGMSFSTQAGTFITGRDGATVEFTQRGAKLSGFAQAPRSTSVTRSTNGWARETMRGVQQKLTDLGYRPGPVDGLWGRKTRDAIAKFQGNNGLEASGQLNAETLEYLGI